jgi:hypothetical protein
MREVRYPPPTNITISISAPPSTTLPIHTVIDLAAKKVVATLPSTGNANRLKITWMANTRSFPIRRHRHADY